LPWPTAGGIFSAQVVLEPVAICKSPNWGYWGAIHGLGTVSASTALKINKEKQNAAAAQAAQCSRVTSNDSCNSLFPKKISYTKIQTQHVSSTEMYA